jgi:hypothetical protein
MRTTTNPSAELVRAFMDDAQRLGDVSVACASSTDAPLTRSAAVHDRSVPSKTCVP